MPELTPIDEWAAINDISDSVEKRKKYSAYMKAEFLREGIDGETMRETFGAIDQSLLMGLQQDGLNEEEIAEALKPSQATFEDKFKIVDRALGVVTDNDDLRALSDYDAFQKVTSEQTDLPPDYLARGDELRMRAEEVVNANYEDAAQWMSVNEDVPFTRITLGDGTVRLIGNNAAVGLTPLQAYEKSLAIGSIKEEDIDKVLNLMQKDEKGFEAFRHERFAETSKALGDAMKDDEVLNNNLSAMIGEYGRNGQVSDVSRDTFKTTLLSKIPAMNAMYSDADVNAVLDYLVGQQAMVSGEAPFDSDNPTSGIRDFGYGYTAIHQSLLQNKEQFDKATADMSPEKVRVLELQRDAYRTKLFPQYSQALKNSSVGDEWTEFYATKKVDGMEDADILDAFIEGKEYDWLAANVQHLALAVGEGFTDIMWGIGAAMGNDTARDNLLENLRDREARRMTANLFGQEMGFGMEVAEVAAPLIADMLGTVALTTATGALGAGTAVAGSIAKNTMKSTFRNTIQSVAKNATIDLGQTTAKQAVPTIRKFSEAYAGIVGSKATGYAAMFTTAATRSGTMTYANVYDVLKRENDANGGSLTDEEIHQKALGAGLTAGAITGSITLAFSTMGAGGVEDFILNRATGKDVKRVFDALSRRELTDAQYQAALSKVLANGHEEFTKKAGVGLVRRMAVGATGEAAEEGTDEYFNSIVQAVATNQDLSFLEVASQAGMGAVFGGILGAGTPAISRAYRSVTRKLDGGIGDEVARREVESKVAEQAANLVESGSPVTAEVFQQAMATAPERLPQAPADAEEAPADAEEAPADVDGEPDVIWSPDVTQFDQELGEFEPDSPIYDADVALSLLSPLAQDTLAKVEAFNNGESAWASAPDLIKARNEIRLYREELEKQTGTERLAEFSGMLQLEQMLDDEIEARKAGGRNQLFGHLFDGINLPPDEVEEAVAEVKRSAARMRATKRTGVTPQTRVEVTPPPAARMRATQRTGVTPQTRRAASDADITADTAADITADTAAEATAEATAEAEVLPEITAEDEATFQQELQEELGMTEEEAVEVLEENIIEVINETDTGDLDDGKDAPSTPEEEKTVEDTFKERVDELIQTGMIVNINSGTHGLPTGLKRDFIKAEKDRLVREIKAHQKDKKSDRYVPSTAEVLKAYGISADTVKKMASVPNATGEMVSHSDYGYLFNNDPLVVKEALKRNQPVTLPEGYDGPFNADLFVVIDGRVTEVKEPQRVGGEQKKTKAEIASQDVSDALARSFELINAFNPSDVEVTFRQAGFSPKRVFAQASKRMEGESDEEYVERLEQLERDLTVGADQIFVLDESMTVKEAIKHFRRWAGGLYAGLIESHRTIDVNLYRNAANIKRMGLPQEQTDEILASSVADFVADIEASIHLQGLRQKLEPLMTDGSLASADMNDIMNALFDSDIARELNLAEGLLSMRAIDRKLKELGKLQWGKTTTAKTDLIAQADTPAKKLAAFLYYATAGKGTKAKGMVSDEEFNKSIVGFAKAKAFKAGWEEKIVKRSLESLLDIEQFKPKPNAPFPNFMTAARRVGDRVRKRSEGFRVANKQKRAEVDLETVQVTPDMPLEPDTVKNFYDTFRYEAGLQIDREILSLPEEQRTEVVDILKNLMVRTYGLRETILQEQGEDVLGFTTESFRSIVTHFLKELTKQRVAGNPNVLSGGRAGNYFAQNYKKLPLNTTRYLVIAGFQPPFDLPTDDIISLDDVQEEVLYEFGQFKAPNLLDRKNAQLYRAKNNEDMVRLGLVDGNPQSVIDALEEIKRNGVDESHQLVAGLLLRNKQTILNTAFEVIDNPDSGYAGLYDESSNKVTLNLSSSYGSGIESVLLHEYLHVATVGLLRSNNLTAKQRAALTRLQNLRLLVRDAYERSGKRHIAIDNGVSNNEEFVASVFTSVAFQNAVRSLPEKGWFRRILNAVKDFFGIPPKDKLRKAFDDLVDFLNMEQAPKERVIDTLGSRRFFAPDENTRIVQDELNKIRAESELEKRQMYEEQEGEVRYSPLDGIDSDDTLTPEQRRTMDSLIDEVIGMTVPADVPVVEMVEGNADLFADRPNALFATTYSQIGGKQVVTILLNRNAAQKAVFEMTNQVYDTTHVKAILESILNEEIVHAAELRTIAPAELDAVLEEMVEDDLLNTVDDYTDNLVRRNELKTAIQNGDQNIRRQMLGELLRMKAQRITRGYTTEQDKAFYATNPRFHQVMLRYLIGVFKRFAAKRNLRKDNPEMARMVNKMAYEVALLRSGVFRIAERLHFDINSPDANVADLERRFSATFEDEPEKEITAATTTEEIKNRYPLFKAFDIALGSFTEGEYKANTGIMRMLNGDLDPRIMELRRQADAVKQAVDTNAQAIFKEVSKMVQNDPNIDDETLADFLGRPNDMDLPEGYLQARVKVFQERYKREVNERGRVTSEEREAMYKEEVTDKAANEVARMIDSAKSKQAAAKRYINRNNPALYRKLMELRNFLDSLSKIFTEQFDTQGKLRAVVDTRLGVYVVRAYRAFLEEGYLDRIIKIAKGEAKAGDETMVRQYQMVYELFEETYHRQFAKEERKRERKNDVPEQDRATFESLIEASTEELNRLREEEGQDPIRGAIIDYLYSLDPNTKYAHSHTNIANSVTKSLVSNIRKREQLPLALRQLLGQYDDADALNNIMRSIYTVGHAASNESFITNMIRLGRVEGAKFIYNIEEVRKMQRTEEGRTKTANMVNLRTGGRVNEAVLRKETTGDEVETDYSKALDYYVDKEILDQLRMQFQRDVTSDLSFEKKKVEQFFNVWKTLTGASLGAKTLFSFGFYIRNVLGNLAFFAPLQGLNPIKVAKKLGHVTKALKGQAGQIDAYTAELTSLNLIQGDLTVRTVQDLLRGKTTLEQQEEEIGKVTEKIRALKAKGKKVSEKTLEPMMNYLMDLSQAVDAFYKIAAYEHELDYQKKARAHDIANGKDTGFLDLSDYDLKTRAAKKVRQTSQSYVDAYESVKYATKKWSFILAPFLRFRFDIIRIMFEGTPKLIRQEIKSDNPIERKRGIQRLAGFVGTIGGMSFTIPLALRMMSGIGEEEEELLREGYLPDYQKNATLWFFGKDKFVDATFLNPLGSVTDPLLRASEHSLNGDFSTAAVTLIKMLGEEYGGQQILSSAVASAMANKDARTGDPIYEEDDGLIQVWKFMKYVYLEAYNPRVALAGSRAIGAAVGDEATKWDRSVAGIISREFMPSRLSDIDWERALRNGISKKQDERNRMRSALNKLRSSGSLTDGDIESATDTFVRGQQKVDSDLSNYILAARNMGVSDMEIDRSLGFYKISKDRVSDLRYGRFRRPDIPEPLAIGLQEMGAVGVERLRKAYARLREYPSFSFLD